MEDKEQLLRQWAETAGCFHLPRWEELPELELYMDQVVVLLEAKLAGLLSPRDRLITPAMVNNYVKLGLIPKPNKKKYSRRHLAYLVAILLMKELFPIAQIRAAIQMQTDREGSGSRAYNLFCTETEHALAAACAEMLGRPVPAAPLSGPDGRLLRMAARAFAFRAAAAQEAALETMPAETE